MALECVLLNNQARLDKYVLQTIFKRCDRADAIDSLSFTEIEERIIAFVG